MYLNIKRFKQKHGSDRCQERNRRNNNCQKMFTYDVSTQPKHTIGVLVLNSGNEHISSRKTDGGVRDKYMLESIIFLTTY